MKLVFRYQCRWLGGGSSVMDRCKWRSWKETTEEITLAGCTLEVMCVNTHYSRSPMRGRTIPSSKEKVNIRSHQRTAIHALLTPGWVSNRSHSHDAAFEHLNGCFANSKVVSHHCKFSIESRPEEPRAEREMWVKLSRAASFTRSEEFQQGLWLQLCLITAGTTCTSQSSQLE